MGSVRQLSSSGAAVLVGTVVLVLLSACSVDRSVRQDIGHGHPFSRRTGLDATRPFQTTANPYRNLVMQLARAQLGKPYRWGGKSPGNGFDCSGLVFFVHRQAGLKVPRMSQSQMSAARKVALHNIQPGDLVFFWIDSKISHVGIYVGGGEFIHAPSQGKMVSRESLKSHYWYQRLVAVGNFYR